MQRQPLAVHHRDRVTAGLPFVESLARRVASSMPHSIELSDLVQDGMIGLIDAACRYDEARGIKFETFAERRVRGAMIDALRRDAWPRGVRRQRRELEVVCEQDVDAVLVDQSQYVGAVPLDNEGVGQREGDLRCGRAGNVDRRFHRGAWLRRVP